VGRDKPGSSGTLEGFNSLMSHVPCPMATVHQLWSWALHQTFPGSSFIASFSRRFSATRGERALGTIKSEQLKGIILFLNYILLKPAIS
jgi:hypothetical protein